jgi:putative hemin transport protein
MQLNPDLPDRYAQLKRDQPRLRIRDAADQLAVSEAELLVATASPQRLDGPWPELMEAVRSLGPVMALTRNEMAVHEKTGAYLEVRMDNPHVGGVYGPDIDLRLFPGRWAHAFATEVATPAGPRASLQIFDAAGVAVHKIYVTADTDRAAYDDLVQRFSVEPRPVVPEASDTPPRADTATADELLPRWAAMTDTHDFFVLLRDLDLHRRRALQLAEGHYTWRVDRSATETLLRSAAQRQVPLMCFVGNAGCIQIHSGPVHRIVEKGGWLNVLDPGFNLHLRSEQVAEAWVVHKPTDDGIVSSLELLDADGEARVLFFGVRKPGIEEDPAWRTLTDEARGA